MADQYEAVRQQYRKLYGRYILSCHSSIKNDDLDAASRYIEKAQKVSDEMTYIEEKIEQIRSSKKRRHGSVDNSITQ